MQTTLQKLGACQESLKWIATQADPETAWQNCHRGDWMLWLLGKLDADRKQLVLACCKIARLSLKYIPENENRPRIAIEIAEKWCRGEATLEEVESAADAAYAAAAYYGVDANTAAAYAATYTANAAAYAAAYAVFYNTTKSQTLLQQYADIVREFFPNPPIFNYFLS